jgi:hypothetical protein
MGSPSVTTPPSASVSPAAASAAPLRNSQRFLWCALGGLLPSLLHLSQQSNVVQTVRQMGWVGVVDEIFVAFAAILIAGLMALIFRDEANSYKLVILGVSGPALISSWLAVGNANINAAQLENFKLAASSLAAQGYSTPQPQSRATLPAFSIIPAVEAATTDIKPFPRYVPGAIEQLGASLTSSQAAQRNYFVILVSSANPDNALAQKQSISGRLPGKDVEVFRSPDGYSPVLYCVVVSPNLTFADANALLKQVGPMGFTTAYVWTFGLPLRPPPK